ncbi:unnamed protein product [Trichobilharzia regenti]|nr:unnamed protein product [Trichobilharzia regenti]
MNAKLGGDNTGRELAVGREDLGEMNDNGELFSGFCAFNDLVIDGSVFKHKNIHKATWISPDGLNKEQETLNSTFTALDKEVKGEGQFYDNLAIEAEKAAGKRDLRTLD